MAEAGALPGGGIVRASFAGTAALAVAAVAGVVDPEPLGLVTATVAVVLFAAGCGLFLWAYGIAVNRSRTDAIGIGGLYFLAGSAPKPVRLRLLGSFAAQVVIAVAAASARPYTNLAFAVLAPVYGLGLSGLWAARHGRFGARLPRGGDRAGAAGGDQAERAGGSGGPAAGASGGPAAGASPRPQRRQPG